MTLSRRADEIRERIEEQRTEYADRAVVADLCDLVVDLAEEHECFISDMREAFKEMAGG